MSKDLYIEISAHFGIESVENLIADRRNRFIDRYGETDNYLCQMLRWLVQFVWLYFLFIVFVYLRLLNFSLFFHLCRSTTYVGEIKLYINMTTAPSGQRSCLATGTMHEHQQAAPRCNTIHPPQHANYTCGEKKTRRAVSAQLSTVPDQLFMRTVVPMLRNDNERSHYQFVDYGSGIWQSVCSIW